MLTSSRTFSTAEEYGYELQALKRATIGGERTAGGAHVGTTRRLTDRFFVFIPSGRSVNPITHTNWEGTGVAPDIAVPARIARDPAYVAALKKSIESAPDAAEKGELELALSMARAALESSRVEASRRHSARSAS